MSTPSIHAVFQSFLDDAVAQGIAPGFQCVIFNRDTFLYNGVSGLASAPSHDMPEGKPFKPETICWVASCTKISISLIVLHIIERGLAKTGFSIKDLDSHEALVHVLPEFRHGSGSLVTQIIEGFEDKLGTDGKKVMKLKDAKGKVTLRMLLTHTAGMAYYWNHPPMAELYRPSDDSVPIRTLPTINADIQDFVVPLVTEPDTIYDYSPATDWLGQFAVRATGKNLRQLFKEIIFEPLDIPSSEAEIQWLPPAIQNARASYHVRDSNKGFTQVLFPVYEIEHTPPEGKAHFASACVWSSLQAYAKVLQAVLNQDPRILSKEVWHLAMRDDLKDRGIKVPKPLWKSQMTDLTFDIEEFAKSTGKDGGGVNLLQCSVATAPTVSGRPAGSFAWAGLANTYYFIDPVTGIGMIFGTQLFPFFDPQVVEMRDRLEMLVYKTSPSV